MHDNGNHLRHVPHLRVQSDEHDAPHRNAFDRRFDNGFGRRLSSDTRAYLRDETVRKRIRRDRTKALIDNRRTNAPAVLRGRLCVRN